MSWITPKTDWVGTDYFTATDWNRISENTQYICLALHIPFTPNLGTDGRTILSSADRNEVTDALEKIYAQIGASFNRHYVIPRIDYGSAWNSEDLNAIEDLLLQAKEMAIDHTKDNRVFYYTGDEVICGDTISVGLL